MRILYITQTFPPEPGATARPLNQARHLQRLGCCVTILTTMPNYPRGKIYPEYRGKLFKREQIGKVNVIRFWSIPASNSSFILRVISHTLFGIAAGIIGLFLKKYDVVIASIPNIGTEIAGLMVGKLRNTFTIMEQRDIIPDNLAFIGIAPTTFLYRMLQNYFKFMNNKMDAIMVPGENMLECLAARGIERKKLLFVPHGAEPDLPHGDSHFLSCIGKQCKLGSDFIVLYTGSFSSYYDVINYLYAADTVRKTNKEIYFILVGDGPDYEKARQLKNELNLSNVILTGGVSPEEVASIHSIADIFITSYISAMPTPKYMHDYIYTKAAEYFMIGKPVISIEDGEIMGSIINKYNLGSVVQPKKPIILADMVLKYFNNASLRFEQGKAAKEYAVQYLDRKEIIRDFYKKLESILIKK